jgi:paired small multidrug resistance pump
MTYTYTDYIGLVGVAITLIAYLLLNLRKMKATGWRYPFFNALGSVLILFSLWFKWNPAAWWMEVCWLLISLHSVFYYFKPCLKKTLQ